MLTILRGAAIGAAILLGSAASAASISQFNKTTNDGVFALSDAQAASIGYADADYIAFFRVREGNGTLFDAGDTFDSTTLFNSVTSGAGKIIAFLNGTNGNLFYTGDAFADLGLTTVGGDDGYFRGVAFLFSDPGNIVFRGSSTFNSGQSRGQFDGIDVNPIPLPAAAWMLMASVAGLGVMARRKRKAA